MEFDFDDQIEEALSGDEAYEEVDESFFIDDDLGASFKGRATFRTRGRARARAGGRARTRKRRKPTKSMMRRLLAKVVKAKKLKKKRRKPKRRRPTRRARPTTRRRLVKRKPRRKRIEIRERAIVRPSSLRAHPGPCIPTPGVSEPHLLRIISVQLKGVTKRLRRSANQRTATSEHNRIVRRKAYQRSVLVKLAAIQRSIKACTDPKAKKAAQGRLNILLGRGAI